MEMLPTNAYLITEKCGVSQIKPENSKEFKLAEVQKYVDGYIEIVRLNDEQIMVVNEEGKFTKGCNQIASAIAHLHDAIGQCDYIAGDVVICPLKMLP